VEGKEGYEGTSKVRVHCKKEDSNLVNNGHLFSARRFRSVAGGDNRKTGVVNPLQFVIIDNMGKGVAPPVSPCKRTQENQDATLSGRQVGEPGSITRAGARGGWFVGGGVLGGGGGG